MLPDAEDDDDELEAMYEPEEQGEGECDKGPIPGIVAPFVKARARSGRERTPRESREPEPVPSEIGTGLQDGQAEERERRERAAEPDAQEENPGRCTVVDGSRRPRTRSW